MENPQLNLQENHASFDILEQFFLYLRYWHYFLLSTVLCFFIVKYYLNHTISIYETKAKVKIIDDSKNGFILSCRVMTEQYGQPQAPLYPSLPQKQAQQPYVVGFPLSFSLHSSSLTSLG